MRNSPAKVQALKRMLEELHARCVSAEERHHRLLLAPHPEWRWDFTLGVESFLKMLEKDPDSIAGGYPHGFSREAGEGDTPRDIVKLAQELSRFLKEEWN